MQWLNRPFIADCQKVHFAHPQILHSHPNSRVSSQAQTSQVSNQFQIMFSFMYLYHQGLCIVFKHHADLHSGH